MKTDTQQSRQHADYQDKFFEKGHVLLTIWQIIVLLLCWILFLIPCLVTTLTYIAHETNGRSGFYFWHYSEGFQELNFLLIFLTFACGMIAVFCLTSTYIQAQRHRGLIEKWPMFDIQQNRLEHQRAEAFMTHRFGPESSRQTTRYYVVSSEQNLSNNQLKKVIHGKEENSDGD